MKGHGVLPWNNSHAFANFFWPLSATDLQSRQGNDSLEAEDTPTFVYCTGRGEVPTVPSARTHDKQLLLLD